MLLLAVIAAVIGLPVFAVLLALAQWAVYRVLVSRGLLPADDVPFAGILVMRGMVLGLVLIAGMAVATRLAATAPVPPSAGSSPAR